MNLQEQELFIQDLTARLSYGVRVEHIHSGVISVLDNLIVHRMYNQDGSIKSYLCTTNIFGDDIYMDIEDFKPYLYPMSAMTEAQKAEYCRLQDRVIYNSLGPVNSDVLNYINWLNENHFDYRGLIEKGLALDASIIKVYE